LGIVNWQSIGSGRYKVTVKYPDITYQITNSYGIDNYYRDNNKNIYLVDSFTEDTADTPVTSYKVYKYNACSKEIAVLTLPQSQYEPMPPEASNAPTWTPVPVMEYGEPIVSSTGDVYAWARAKTAYKIVKWKWVDDPKSNDDCSPNGSKIDKGVTK
jgi:hypothetical protein